MRSNTTSELGLLKIPSNVSHERLRQMIAFNNELLDATIGGIDDIDVDTPPQNPISGATYIVGSNPTDAWIGQTDKIAYFYRSWHFISPQIGSLLWIKSLGKRYVYSGIDWGEDPGGGAVFEDNVNRDYIAGEVLSALDIVHLNSSTQKLHKAASSNVDFAGNVIGLVMSASAVDIVTPVIYAGYYFDSGWSWDMTPEKRSLYFNTNGQLTQTAPTSGYVPRMGFVTSPQSIFLKIGDITILR